MDDFEKSIRLTFIEEAEQMLSSAEEYFLALESSPDDINVINMIFRVAHSFKGSAGVAGLEDLADFAHHLESLLVKIKNGQHRADRATIEVLLKANDQLNVMVNGLKGDLERRFDVAPFIIEIDLLSAGGERSPQPTHLAPEMALQKPEAGDGFHLFGEEESPAAAASSPIMAVVAAPASTAPVAAVPVAAPAADENIRVNLRRIDHLVNDVGELVILQTVLFDHRHQIPSVFLQKSVVQLQKITRKIQDTAMGLRLVPVKPVFQKMQRIVRDTGKQMGKEIRIEVFGEDTEIDKSILDLLGDPLLHMIRNSVDHGIESPAERKALGKPEMGTVTLRAFLSAGHNVIEIVDDGRGLNVAKLVAKAESSGLVPKGAIMSDAEAYKLIFMPGFSTKEEVSAVSGRGVGMDVVKTNVERMQGIIEIESTLGQGSCFRILLPLTLAIIDAMLVNVIDQSYVIPLATISESLHPETKDINFVSDHGYYISIREETMQLFWLGDLLGRHVKEKSLETAVALVFRYKNAGAFAVIVDEIVGRQQVVIKKLGLELQGEPGISGAAILGNGKASLIIDLYELTMAHKDRAKLRKLS